MDYTSIFEKLLFGYSGGYIVTDVAGYNREIIDGGTKNRIWTFATNNMLLTYSMWPLYELYPGASFSVPYWTAMAVNAGCCYLASIYHQNQIYINQGEHDKITKLPYDLHENKFLMGLANFLSLNLQYFFIALYTVSIAACFYYGMTLYAIGAIGGCFLQQLYQNGYMPEVLRLPFMYASMLGVFLATMSFNSTISLCLGLSFLGYTIYDHVSCYLWNTTSPTAQFPMASKEKEVKAAKDVGTKASFDRDIKAYRDKRYPDYLYNDRPTPIVTFDHFFDSFKIIQDLLKNVPKDTNVDEYRTLFDNIDFHDEGLRDIIINQLVEHEKFNSIFKFSGDEVTEIDHAQLQPFCESKKTGAFKVGMSRIDAAIEFLKIEMSWVPYRLKNDVSRDLTPYQFNELKAYGRLVLSKIQKNPAKHQGLLIAIAVTTGTHCNRMYLESLSRLVIEHNLIEVENFTLRQKLVMELQKVREKRFRTYYRDYVKQLKQESPIFNKLYADEDDYHTYENFVQTFGANLYLVNSSLVTGIRNVMEVICDRIFNVLLSQQKIAFKNYYSADFLIAEVLDPRNGCLHNLFLEWCREHMIPMEMTSEFSGYFYDEYYLMRDDDLPQALAELMLLDLNIIEHEQRDWIPESLLSKTKLPAKDNAQFVPMPRPEFVI